MAILFGKRNIHLKYLPTAHHDLDGFQKCCHNTLSSHKPPSQNKQVNLVLLLVLTFINNNPNPFSETHWVSRLKKNFTSSSDREGLETGLRSTLNGHEGETPDTAKGNPTGYRASPFPDTRVFETPRIRALAWA
jgi:hypothetical protein